MTGFSWWPLVTATGLDCSRGSDRDDTITLEWHFTVWSPAWYSLEIIANTQLTKLWWSDERYVLSSVLCSVVDWLDWLLTSSCWGRGGRRGDGWQSEEESLSSGSAPVQATGSGWASLHLPQHHTSTFFLPQNRLDGGKGNSLDLDFSVQLLKFIFRSFPMSSKKWFL